MQAGKLRHRITLQKPVKVQDPETGSVENIWQDLAQLWAEVSPLSAREFVSARAMQNAVTTRITVRYRQDIEPKYRILFRGKIFNIEGVLSDPKSGIEYLTLPCSEERTMADGVEYTLTGVDELMGKLESISDDMKRKGGRAALRKAANVIANRAKANAQRLDDPETGRSIADNIAVRWNGREFKRNGNLAFRIGVLHGAVLKTSR